MGSDRYHWDLVCDGDSSRSDLAAANAKIGDMAREMGQLKTELETLRAARAADAERVRSVVRDAVHAAWPENKFGGNAPDAIADRVAEQLAGAGVGLSSSDRVRLQSIIDLLRKQPVCWDMESALLERLLASQTATWVCPAQSNECAIRQKCTNKCGRNDYQHLADLHSAICALLDSDLPAGDLRKALAELVGRR